MLSMESSRRPARHDGGFTLVEVVVALAVAGLFAGVAMPVAQDAVQRLMRSREQGAALIAACSALETHALVAAHGEGVFEQRHGAFVVKTQVSAVDGAETRGAISLVLRRIRVDVHGSQAQEPLLSLVTYRVGRKP
jgi:prepilin-type N-terminal cleavage/methylation domain-containing protein